MPLPLTQESILRVLVQDIHDDDLAFPQSTLSLTPDSRSHGNTSPLFSLHAIHVMKHIVATSQSSDMRDAVCVVRCVCRLGADETERHWVRVAHCRPVMPRVTGPLYVVSLSWLLALLDFTQDKELGVRGTNSNRHISDYSNLDGLVLRFYDSLLHLLVYLPLSAPTTSVRLHALTTPVLIYYSTRVSKVGFYSPLTSGPSPRPSPLASVYYVPGY